MPPITEKSVRNQVEQSSFGFLVSRFFSEFSKYWGRILLLSFSISTLIAFFLYMQKREYTARTSFLIQEKSLSTSSLANLAGQFGFDIGSSMSGGFFGSDNVTYYLRTDKLCRDVLLETFDTLTGQKYIDAYYRSNPMKQIRFLLPNRFKNFDLFSQISGTLTREQDSVLQVISKFIINSKLAVNKLDRKSGFVEVKFNCTDERLAKFFCEKIVNRGIEYYLVTKLSTQKINVDRLSARADSIYRLLTGKSKSSLELQQWVVDNNPGNKSSLYEIEKVTIDKSVLGAIYVEVVKNLELAKIALNNETPIVQVVDTVHLPLVRVKRQLLLKFSFIFFTLVFLSTLYMLLRSRSNPKD
jgi:hypothetical protein